MKIPTKISEKIVTQNPYLKVLEKKFVDKSGETSSFLITAHNKEKTDATFILPLTKDNKIISLLTRKSCNKFPSLNVRRWCFSY